MKAQGTSKMDGKLVASPISSTSESTATDEVAVSDQQLKHDNCPLPRFTRTVMADHPLVKASFSPQSIQSRSKSSLDVSSKPPSSHGKPTLSAVAAATAAACSSLDDRFGSAFNFCDSRSLRDLRAKRFSSPIIICEDDDDNEERDDGPKELMKNHVRTELRVTAAMLDTPRVHREVWGWDCQASSFIIQHVGFVYHEAPHILIS